MPVKSAKSQLEEKTVLQLKKLASKKDIKGRSSMKKSQLVKALMKNGMKGGNRRLTFESLKEIMSEIWRRRAEFQKAQSEMALRRENYTTLKFNNHMYFVTMTYNRETNTFSPKTYLLYSVFKAYERTSDPYLKDLVDVKIGDDSLGRRVNINELILSNDGNTLIHISPSSSEDEFRNIIDGSESIESKVERENSAKELAEEIGRKKNEAYRRYMNETNEKNNYGGYGSYGSHEENEENESRYENRRVNDPNLEELYNNINFKALKSNPCNTKSYYKLARKFHPNKAKAGEENRVKKTKQFQIIESIYQRKK